MSQYPRCFQGQPVIVGSGLAGLMTALSLAPEPTVLLSLGPLGEYTSSALAQGGMAASIAEDDSPARHLDDTVAAGNGLVDVPPARRILEAAPAIVRRLSDLGVRFDREGEAQFALGLEAAHSRRRIVHAAGDGTGREIVRALVEAIHRTPSIVVFEGAEARRLLVENGRVAGVMIALPSGPLVIPTSRVVLATGGIGGLFQESTNPRTSIGQGLALAAQAGAILSNLEFIQFHPTALDTPARPMRLISEAVRGEGAVLIDETGERFLKHLPRAELGPRDEVARGVWSHRIGGHSIFLDARAKLGATFPQRFPEIARTCLLAGIDPARVPIPVRPAVHYHMGGIAVDGLGRTSLPGLWACGEVACTGLHGANRLASNSLTEAAVCASWVAEDVGNSEHGIHGRLTDHALPVMPAASNATPIRPILSRWLGLVRDRSGLGRAVSALLPLAIRRGPSTGPAQVALMMAVSALRREESRGAHFRSDFPSAHATASPSTMSLQDAMATASESPHETVHLAESA
ncbi:L-aspartate oxidase [Labrys miyagiensis]|uniref:L-aspartate oxidase n=1 Tax=Labrys miyagiensis TaxID=346912 RepID=UPI0024E07F35|nr:L-aspartate oxidase [Labrys miyagiensis]